MSDKVLLKPDIRVVGPSQSGLAQVIVNDLWVSTHRSKDAAEQYAGWLREHNEAHFPELYSS